MYLFGPGDGYAQTVHQNMAVALHCKRIIAHMKSQIKSVPRWRREPVPAVGAKHPHPSTWISGARSPFKLHHSHAASVASKSTGIPTFTGPATGQSRPQLMKGIATSRTMTT